MAKDLHFDASLLSLYEEEASSLINGFIRQPETSHRNQIDHISPTRNFEEHGKMLRGADISSEHHQLMMTLRLYLKSLTTQQTGHGAKQVS